MRSWPSWPVLVAAIVSVAEPAGAQDSPRDVAVAFFKAVAEERWRDAAGLLDLRAFERYRRQQVEWLRQPMPEPTITVEELLRHDPQMPREVAEYEVKRIRERSRTTGDYIFEREYAGITSVDTLAALSVQDAAARWLQAQDHRWMWRLAQREAARRGCPSISEPKSPEPAQPHEIVGVVVADTVAYVLHKDPVFQMRSGDIDFHGPSPVVMHLRRRATGRWYILPRYDVLRANGTFVSMDCEPVKPPVRTPPQSG